MLKNEYRNLATRKGFYCLFFFKNKQLIICFLIMALPRLADSQIKGIQFVEGLNWEQVKEKAKAANKYIFVDCYATWCGPCKKMDREVYTDEGIGSFIDSNFISIKVQMDSTKKDNENVKVFYAAAREFEKKYNVAGLPTFLFFSPDGKIVHRGVGQRNAVDFVSLVAEAINPDKQLYAIINSWRLGKIPYTDGKELTQKLKRESVNNEIILEIAKDYMHRCLDVLDEDDFCSKDNQIFMAQNRQMFSVNDRIFKLYFSKPEKVDEILLGKGFAKHVVCGTIVKEEILPLVDAADDAGKKISWSKIERNIRRKYDMEMSTRSMLDAKVRWFKKRQNWESYSACLVEQIKRLDIEAMNPLYLNQSAWDIFKYSSNKKEIKEAIKWVDVILRKDSSDLEFVDTKACLLYKLGHREEAIALEETIVVKSKIPKYANHYQSRADCMKKGEDIWVVFKD